MFLLRLRKLPRCGDQTAASVPPPIEGRSSPSNTTVFPPTSFLLPSFVWFYIFFSTGQVLLSPLSWCSACTSVFEGVFLMYPRREMYSRSTYPLPSCSPPILNIKYFDCVINCGCFYNSLLKLFIQINSPIRASFFFFFYYLLV